MVRQKPRKSVEELYAPKFETTPVKSQVQHVSNTAKSLRNERDFSGYIISSNTSYNATSCSAPNTNSMPGASQVTNRRKSTRPNTTKTDKVFNKDEKVLNLDEVKVDHCIKAKTTRPEKCRYNSPNMYDNKSYVNFTENNPKDVHQSQHHHHQHMPHDDDKDDDTEEFFELIRHTVENAIGKSVSDLLNRNFRELSAKVDRFSGELKATNVLLNKLQTDLNNKVVHYGEENSRHFRYLCMKSEYDKMFYQHHSMMAAPSAPPPDKRSAAPKPNMHNECDKMATPCSCRSSKPPMNSSEPQKCSSAEEQSVSNKSSEMGMREVLEHIQRFCNQMQLNDLKCDDRMTKGSFRLDDAVKINKQVFEEDDDDFQLSSDGMTPRSDDHIHKYGGNTMRSCSGTRNGGGDA